MNILLFGAAGMVGQGVLRECLIDPEVTNVLAVVRAPLQQSHAKLHIIIHKDFTNFSTIKEPLNGVDACFFCLGVSSFRMTEAAYSHITYDFTMAAAEMLVKLNPAMIFTYVSGLGTDSTEKGPSMWARVKGKTENALLRLPFKGAYMFRPGLIQAMHGVKSKTPIYQIPYFLLRPFVPLLLKYFPNYVTTTQQMGRAMLHVARNGSPKKILESLDINQL